MDFYSFKFVKKLNIEYMTVITNHLLKHFIINPDESLFNNDCESEECVIANKLIDEEAFKFFADSCSHSAKFQQFFDAIENSSERRVILFFLAVKHLIDLRNKSKKKLTNQLTLCQDFLKSDMCKRDSFLKKLVEKEELKLKLALDNDIVTSSVSALNSFYKGLYPNDSKIERSIKVSEALHYLSIYKNDPFMTLEEADNHALRNGLKSGRKVIYWNLKDYIK